MVTVIDGVPDTFRPSIWNATTCEVVYDNLAEGDDGTVLRGGSS